MAMYKQSLAILNCTVSRLQTQWKKIPLEYLSAIIFLEMMQLTAGK